MKCSDYIIFPSKWALWKNQFSRKTAIFTQKLLLCFLQIFVLLLSPFVVLIRLAVLMHEQYGFQAWFCLLVGALAAAVLLFCYMLYLQDRLIGKALSTRILHRTYAVLLAIVLMYCVNSVWSISIANVKESEVKKEFRCLHPVLRLSISTLILLDKKLILTDAERKPENYRQMGLPSKRYSLHYVQSTGYAHAVDIRTKGHGWIRNKLIQSYFELMGFSTLFHKGTAEHLHVSLNCRDYPGGI